MKYSFLKSVAAALIISVSGLANASLIFSNEDLISAGDDLIIQDHVNDMQWGNWSYTKGASVNNFLSNSAFANKGFRLATQQDLELLFNTAGAAKIDYDGSWQVSPAEEAANKSAIRLLNSFTNHSITDNWADTSGNKWIHSFYDNGIDNNSVGFVRFNSEYRGVIDIYSRNFTNRDSTYSQNATSAWSMMLVRNGSVSDVSSVPEPSTLAIFALGIMGLASRRFKKQS